MQRLRFSTVINASKEKVWDTMLQDATYRQWTEPFHVGSYFEGTWEKGSTIKFLAANDNGTLEGMVSRIQENRPYEFISIEHMGVIKDGKEDVASNEAKKWAGAQENYTFIPMGEGTQVLVEIDVDEGYINMFDDMWPKALQKLKEIVE